MNKLKIEDIHNILISPDSGKKVNFHDDSLTDGTNIYPIINGNPILLPTCIQKYYKKGNLDIPFSKKDKAYLQYYLISQIKAYSGNPNSDQQDIWYKKHINWSKDLLRQAKGMLLDIGCDDVRVSTSMMPDNVKYVGLDPLSYRGHGLKIVGMGEALPFLNNSFDNVLFLTSLDHVFDYHTALEEAKRVLISKGKIFISTLVWYENADLFADTVHFHHFREYEILEAILSLGFKIEEKKYYPWKDNAHRKVLQLIASK